MKQTTFLESFIVRPLHFFSGHHQNYAEAGLEYTMTNFESHQVQKYLTFNQNMLMKLKL
jgi:hypothetical protein